MDINNRVTKLFNIKYPVIQGGMVWVSGYKLVSAVSNAGGLGLIGAGSMKPELLIEHIQKTKNSTVNSFGVNIPLLRKDAVDLIKVSIENDVKIFFTSAGHPGKYIDKLKTNNSIVVHVVSNLKQALKAQEVGCDAIVAEGVEAGGHNGADELTIFSLIPNLSRNLEIPVIAAGGISTGEQILSSLCLGAEGVQIGTLFAASMESSAHPEYKHSIINAKDNSTVLAFRQSGLIRMIRNEFAEKIISLESKGVTAEELKEILGAKREMLGIFEGDSTNGCLEAGQGAVYVKNLISVSEIFNKLNSEFDNAQRRIKLQ